MTSSITQDGINERVLYRKRLDNQNMNITGKYLAEYMTVYRKALTDVVTEMHYEGMNNQTIATNLRMEIGLVDDVVSYYCKKDVE